MVKHLSLKKNTAGKDYVVGDIHGCFAQLEQVLEMLNFDPTKDRLIAVGDLIDRGDENLEALEYLNKEWFYSIIGNHEAMHIAQDFDGHYQKGMAWAYGYYLNKLRLRIKNLYQRYQKALEKESNLKEHIYVGRIMKKFNLPELDRFEENGVVTYDLEEKPVVDEAKEAIYWQLVQKMHQLPLMIDIETDHGLIGVVHAEIPMVYKSWNEAINLGANISDDKLNDSNLIWSRARIGYYETQSTRWDYASKVSGVSLIICGHTIVEEAMVIGNHYFIDTGLSLTMRKDYFDVKAALTVIDITSRLEHRFDFKHGNLVNQVIYDVQDIELQ
ncbi:MAG: metallophosphoesterase [Thiotrichales bacterium]|jgi:serine/threonine protein phosphatase 1|nr:metallophosphoesterase [Thiotrichales bacterium]